MIRLCQLNIVCESGSLQRLAEFVDEMSTLKQLRWDKGIQKLLEMLTVALLRVRCMTRLSLTFFLSWY